MTGPYAQTPSPVRKLSGPDSRPLILAVVLLLASTLLLFAGFFSSEVLLPLLGYLTMFAVVACPALQRHLDAARSETERILPDASFQRMQVLMWLAVVAIALAIVHGWRLATWMSMAWLS